MKFRDIREVGLPRLLCLTLALEPDLSLAQTRPAPTPLPPSPPPIQSARAIELHDALPPACAGLREVDLDRVGQARPASFPPHPDTVLDAAKRVQGPDAPRSPTGSIVLTMTVGAGYTQPEPFETATIVAKEGNGVWRFLRVDYYVNRERAQALYPSRKPQPTRKVTTGELAPDLAARLDSAFASPCLPFEPDYAPPGMPLYAGGIRPCFDGAYYTILIEQSGRRRVASQACNTVWETGAIIRVLEGAHSDPRAST